MKRILLSAFLATVGMAVSAQNVTVVKEKTLPEGHCLQVVEDAQGHLFRQLVKPVDSKAVATNHAAKATTADEVTFYEGFEDYQEDYGMNWIPANWTEINTPANVPTDEQLKHNINMTWMVYLSSNFYQDMTTDGTKEAFIHFGYVDNENNLTAAAQDEWLVSPEMTLAANETLHFLLQADYFDVYDVTDFDWSALTYPNPRTVVNTLKVMLSENDGETWTEVWDLAKNVTDQLTDVQCYDNSDLHIRRQHVSLADYAGKQVKLAFRYVRDEGDWKGNSMIVDSITVSHPSATAIENVTDNAPQTDLTEYFSVNGCRLASSRPSAKGVYLERRNGVTRKVTVK